MGKYLFLVKDIDGCYFLKNEVGYNFKGRDVLKIIVFFLLLLKI